MLRLDKAPSAYSIQIYNIMKLFPEMLISIQTANLDEDRK
jgi:hypothetical protein